MIVYTEILNIANEVALPFCACDDGSLGNGANGTNVDEVNVWFSGGLDCFVGATELPTIVVLSGDNGANGTFVCCSGKGANGTIGANGTLSLLTALRTSVWIGWTAGWPPIGNGAAGAVVVSTGTAMNKKLC